MKLSGNMWCSAPRPGVPRKRQNWMYRFQSSGWPHREDGPRVWEVLAVRWAADGLQRQCWFRRDGEDCAEEALEDSRSTLWVTCIGMFASSSPLDYKLLQDRDCVNFNKSLKPKYIAALPVNNQGIPTGILPLQKFNVIRATRKTQPPNHLYDFPKDIMAE